MRWLLALFFFWACACKMATPTSDLVKLRTEKAYVYLIKLPRGYQNDVWFNGGSIEIHKPKKGRVILQFERSGTVNNVSILAPSWESGNFLKIEDCDKVKESFFTTQSDSSIDITELTGIFLIQYGSCNIAGSYTLVLK